MKITVLFSAIIFLSSLGANASGGDQMTADYVIKILDLKPLPEEGGYFRETYRSDKVDAPARIFGLASDEPRVISTAIYYLVRPESFSALHRIKSDEVFHFYAGDPVEMIQIDEACKLTRYTIGNDLLNGDTPQVVVRKGTWQALKLKDGGAWALMGTTVSPGFEFSDFELGHREKMLSEYPHLKNDIIRFTRGANEKAH